MTNTTTTANQDKRAVMWAAYRLDKNGRAMHWRASGLYDTEHEAIEWATRIATLNPGKLFVVRTIRSGEEPR